MEPYLGKKAEVICARLREIEGLLADPEVAVDRFRSVALAKERSELAEPAAAWEKWCDLSRRIGEAEEVRQQAREAELREMAAEELAELVRHRDKIEEKIKGLLLPREPDKNIFLEIRAGAGGEEAALFASELFRMYAKYAERRRWKMETLSSSATGIGGIKEAIALIEGKGAYRALRHESGVHRVQRVPVTEASGRIHTSTVTVAVIPEAEEVEVQVDPKDLRVDTFCSSGPGGQSVNTTYSAVRITHLPTGVVVSCQDERSQLKNKMKAMRILRSRLLEAEKEKQRAEIGKTRKLQVGSGERSEKIRTYNFPQNRVTDHRINLTLHRLDQILGGDLDEMVQALMAADEMEQTSGLYGDSASRSRA